MIHFKSLSIILCISFLIVAKQSQAATFCVSTSQELQDALYSAEDNGQADHIKINQGTYMTLSSLGFHYDAAVNENYELKITGGWADFFNAPCGRQPSTSPFATTLNANFIGRIMTLNPSRFSDVIISSLLFRNGLNLDPYSAAGLKLSTSSSYLGDALIENCAFINNEAIESAALKSQGGNKIIVRNNLFAFNHTEYSSTIQLVLFNGTNTPNDSRGIYFTNNTLVANTNDDTSELGHTSGLYLYIEEYSKAFIANNLFWGNEVNDLFIYGDGYKYLLNNNIEKILGSADVEDNNLSIAPRFEPGFANFNLSAGSALIDAGIKPPNVINNPPTFDETWSLGGFDIEQNIRVQSEQVDIGAYESPFNSDIIFHNSFEIF